MSRVELRRSGDIDGIDIRARDQAFDVPERGNAFSRAYFGGGRRGGVGDRGERHAGMRANRGNQQPPRRAEPDDADATGR